MYVLLWKPKLIFVVATVVFGLPIHSVTKLFLIPLPTCNLLIIHYNIIYSLKYNILCNLCFNNEMPVCHEIKCPSLAPPTPQGENSHFSSFFQCLPLIDRHSTCGYLKNIRCKLRGARLSSLTQVSNRIIREFSWVPVLSAMYM